MSDLLALAAATAFKDRRWREYRAYDDDKSFYAWVFAVNEETRLWWVAFGKKAQL